MARENEEAAEIAPTFAPPRKNSVVVKAGPIAPGQRKPSAHMLKDIHQPKPDGDDEEIPENLNQRKGGFLDRAKVNPAPAATNSNVVLPATNIQKIKNMKALPTLANKGSLPTVKKMTEGVSPAKKPQSFLP